MWLTFVIWAQSWIRPRFRSSRSTNQRTLSPPMTKFSAGETAPRFWRKIRDRAWIERLPIAPRCKGWTALKWNTGRLWTTRRTRESTLLFFFDFLAATDFKDFSALSSARRIFFPSWSSSANSCWVYSWTVFQPNSDLSARRVSFYLSVTRDVPSVRDSLALSTALDSRYDLASSIESWILALNLYCTSFP